MTGARLKRRTHWFWAPLIVAAALVLSPQGSSNAGATLQPQGPATSLMATDEHGVRVDLNGWLNHDVLVTLCAEDDLDASGPVDTYYTVNGGAPNLYVLPVGISEQGATVISYWSVDQEGHAETPKQAVIRIDRTPPSTQSDAPVDTEYVCDGFWLKPVIMLAATDGESADVSGVVRTEWRIDGGEWREGTTLTLDGSLVGLRTLEYRSTDAAGNIEAATAMPITLYRRYEDYRASYQEGLHVEYRGDWKTHARSGLSHSRMKYTHIPGYSAHFSFVGTAFRLWAPRSEWGGIAEVYVDDMPVMEVDYYDPAQIGIASSSEVLLGIGGLESGPHTVRIVATGRGNSPSGESFICVDAVDVLGTLTADVSPPVTTITYDDEPFQPSSTVILTAHDEGTWVAATHYRLGGSAPIPYTGPFTVTDTGRHTVEYWSVDGMGNTEQRKTVSFTVGPPVCETSATLVPGIPDGAGGWFRTRPSMIVTALPDPHCEGTPRSFISTADGVWEEVFGAFPASEGDVVYRYYSRAGDSMSEIGSFRVAFDSTAPSRPGSPRMVYATGTACVVTWDASEDLASGIGHYRVSRNGSVIGTTTATAYLVEGMQPQTEYEIRLETVDVAGNVSAATTMLVTTAKAGQSVVPVPEGDDVRVELPDGGVLVFDQVTGSGEVRIMPIEPRGAPSSALFRIVHGGYYQIEVDATFVGAVTITLPYDETRLDGWQSANQSQRDAMERSLKFLHRTASGGWENITDHVDTVNNRITGTTTSFSDFWMESVAARRFEVVSPSVRLARHGDSHVLTARLVDDATGHPVANARVRVQSSSDGVSFINTSMVATTSATGSIACLVRPVHRTYYRFIAVHEEIANLQTVSVARVVVPRASVGRLVAPKYLVRGRATTVYGALKPRHTAGTSPVTLQIQRRSGSRWVRHSTVTAMASDYSTYSRYKRSMRFAREGQYRIRAIHPEDSMHASHVSDWRSVTVR